MLSREEQIAQNLPVIVEILEAKKSHMVQVEIVLTYKYLVTLSKGEMSPEDIDSFIAYMVRVYQLFSCNEYLGLSGTLGDDFIGKIRETKTMVNDLLTVLTLSDTQTDALNELMSLNPLIINELTKLTIEEPEEPDLKVIQALVGEMMNTWYEVVNIDKY